MEKVLVLLSTYNGEKYLCEQVQSVLTQKEVEVSLLVRDDGSVDDTTTLLNKYEKKGLLNWYEGPNLGSARSFMNLIMNSPDSSYYAFCDQDDIWDADKLSIAVDKLSEFSNDVPAIYFCKPQLVDKNLNLLTSEMDHYLFTFEESLLRNPATGCTVVFNQKLMFYIKKYVPNYISMHDSWVYRICLAVGGKVVFDPHPHIKYRQHENNVIGGKKSFIKTYKRRFLSLLGKKGGNRLKTAENLLNGYKEDMNCEHICLLEMIVNYKHSFKSKYRLISNKNMRSHNKEARFFFIIAVLLNQY